jgi:uncharacterized Zn-finger protein
MDTSDSWQEGQSPDALAATSRSRVSAGAIELVADDLPAYCPNPKMPLWSSHPRVFLDVVNEREAMCPYCGTRYRLKPHTHVDDHGFGALNLHQNRDQAHGQFDAAKAASASVQYRQAPNVSGDVSGNTRLELISRWLTGRWRS